ncbi:hypothetical protein [Bacillus thuringiensis]|uniref:hypothetical protein n=1 Tax=Bacillus thuringiensis TaxID=1428 RepID=UPI000BF8F252|nr:hypothetical protein [Bacillus thuringiensis]PEV64223.1 hypothetical protein CN434_25780 [Bacillus thuringiensis]
MKYTERDTGKSVNLHEELGIDMLQVSNTVLTFNQFHEFSNLLFLGIMKKMQKIQCKLHLTCEGVEFESTHFEVKEDNGHHLFFIGDDLASVREINSMDMFYNLHKELVIRLYYFSKGVKKYILLRFIPVKSIRKQLITELDKRFNGKLDMSKLTNKPLERMAREAQIDVIIKPQPKLDGSRRMPVMFRGYWATEQLKPNNFELDKDTHIAEALMQ